MTNEDDSLWKVITKTVKPCFRNVPHRYSIQRSFSFESF